MEEFCKCDCNLVEFSEKGLLCPKCNLKKEISKNNKNSKNKKEWDLEKWSLVFK